MTEYSLKVSGPWDRSADYWTSFTVEGDGASSEMYYVALAAAVEEQCDAHGLMEWVDDDGAAKMMIDVQIVAP